MDISIHNAHLPHPRPQWTENFSRFGMAAKGVVYSLVGALAFMAAFEINGNSTEGAGKQGVFRFILEQPFGKILLGIVALGLVCYAIWRFIQAFMDSEGKGADAKGIGKRIGYAFSGLIYGGLAFYAAQLVLGNGGGSGGDSRETLAGKLLEQPFGQWLVGLVAVGTMALGLYQIYKAISGKYLKNMQTASIKPDIKNMLLKAGKVGYIARGIVWGIIGFLFLKAAMNANAQEAGGSSSAFQLLEQSSYGSILLGVVALGLLCYGVFMFVRARYEVINT
jgi:hypothetical protein